MAGDDLDGLVRALSHATRRQILRICARHFVSAGEISQAIELAPASVSEHLKVLRKTELVELQRTGTMWLYRTDIERLGEALADLANDLPTPDKGESG